MRVRFPPGAPSDIISIVQTIDEQIEQIQEEIRKTPHHKGTNRFIGLMRAKIARLKDREIEGSVKSGGGGGGGYSVKKQGDATVVLIGPPSSGKSTLINRLTNAKSKVAPYAFTTVTVVPGMLKYKEAYIQILDIPGLIEGAKEGKGRGREVLSVARNADLLLIMTDTKRIGSIDKIMAELEGAGIRINRAKPDIFIDKKVDGGVEIHSNILQSIDKDTIKDIAGEFGIKNADITLREKFSYERLFDAFSVNRAYIPAIVVINKVDKPGQLSKKFKLTTGERVLEISAKESLGLEDLINEIWNKLSFVTVYLVKEDSDPSFDNPIIMRQGENLKDLALKIGTDFAGSKKAARIWGNNAKFPAQEVSFSTQVADKMQVRFI